MHKNILFAALSSFLLSACSSVSFLAANFPSYFSKQEVIHDIDFGSNNGMKLDVYTPANKPANSPVIIFFYGGAWKMGSKDDYRFVADAFTKYGYVVVIPDYIKYPKVKFPAWQQDAAKAVVWVHNNIGEYGGDAKALVVAGHSAGAHIGALLSTDASYLKKEGGKREWIKAFAGLAGPYHFTPDEPDYIDMFGPPERYRYMQVSTFIDGKQPPMLLMWGKKDKDVGEQNVANLEKALKDKGGEYKVIYYDNIDHIDIIAAFSKASSVDVPVTKHIDQFFQRKNQKI